MNSIERWLAPGMLVGIALVQFGQAQFGTLSPWKGGGFGMFSSVDSIRTRVIGCEAVTTAGEKIRIDTFAGLSPATVDGWRAMPRQNVVRGLAMDIMRMRFVPAAAGDATPDSLPVFRPLSPNEPQPAAGEFVELDSIRVGWWRVDFDFAAKQLVALPIGHPVELSRGQRP